MVETSLFRGSEPLSFPSTIRLPECIMHTKKTAKKSQGTLSEVGTLSQAVVRTSLAGDVRWSGLSPQSEMNVH
jgi:hypothetical protein